MSLVDRKRQTPNDSKMDATECMHAVAAENRKLKIKCDSKTTPMQWIFVSTRFEADKRRNK